MSDEKPKEEEGGAKKAAAPNMMLIIIIAVLGTLLVAGGIGAVLMMKSGSHKADEEHTETAAEAEPAEEEHGSAAKEKEKDKSKGKDKDKKGAKAQTIYIALDPPFVVNFEANHGARFLQVNVQLMTRDTSVQILLNENLPVLRNDLLLLLSSQTYDSVSTTEGKEELRKKALDTARAIVKQEGGKPELLEAVYFTSFVMQ